MLRKRRRGRKKTVSQARGIVKQTFDLFWQLSYVQVCISVIAVIHPTANRDRELFTKKKQQWFPTNTELLPFSSCIYPFKSQHSSVSLSCIFSCVCRVVYIAHTHVLNQISIIVLQFWASRQGYVSRLVGGRCLFVLREEMEKAGALHFSQGMWKEGEREREKRGREK